MKVLFVASEGVPFSKSGGLGDVVGTLPLELIKLGMDVRVILPKYGSIPIQYKERMTKKTEFYVQLGWRRQYCGIEAFYYKGVIFYFIDNEYYFRRDTLYGYADETERYAYFARAVLEALPHIGFFPDILHGHDWQAGMVSVLLKTQYNHLPNYNKIATLYTIHNLKYQGVCSKDVIEDLLGMDSKYFNMEELEFYGCINAMKGGIVFSDVITTVSPTYSLEIQYPYFGEHLEGVIRKRKQVLHGIINGIDYSEYNPSTDPRLCHTYDENTLENKKVNKEQLQKEFGLWINSEIPIIAVISRLTGQKGMDLIQCVLSEILEREIQLIVLGTGEYTYEEMFRQMGWKYKGKVATHITFNEELAHKIYGGADMFLMPSLFEPCGLAQLIALRYGTVPIVRETGGLKDTIQAYNAFNGEGNGFSFTNYNAHDMLYTLDRAIEFFKKKNVWERIVKNGMTCDFSWNQSAMRYVELYHSIKNEY